MRNDQRTDLLPILSKPFALRSSLNGQLEGDAVESLQDKENSNWLFPKCKDRISRSFANDCIWARQREPRFRNFSFVHWAGRARIAGAQAVRFVRWIVIQVPNKAVWGRYSVPNPLNCCSGGLALQALTPLLVVRIESSWADVNRVPRCFWT